MRRHKKKREKKGLRIEVKNNNVEWALKKFKIVDDKKYGWWYYFDKGIWYGIDQKNYSTPPFEY